MGAGKPAHSWRATLKRRLSIAAGVLLCWALAIEARLVYLQVIDHDELSARAERQQNRTIDAPAKRGEILDREGRVLAYSVDAESIYAVPTDIDDPARASGLLCRALQNCTDRDRQALADRIARGRAFVYVQRQVSPDRARRVADLQLEGVGFMKENRRFYPKKELASHLLGYVGIDNVGLGGIEATYDKLIRGTPGRVLIQTDARRHAFSRVERPPTAGASLELTIDQNLQYIVERELRTAVEENRADGGTVVVMDPATGEILALANWPTFNPNVYRQSAETARRNRAVQDIYEPGSTFKIVTASAALEQKLVRPGDLIDASGGSIRFGARVIHDTHDYGRISFTDGIVKSSNVVAILVGLRLGPDRLGLYVRRFGFGRPSSPDFPGESPGIVWGSKLDDSALASVAMGYQVGVTPLQMAAALSAVANGGELLEPRVVRAVVRNGVRTMVPRKVRGRAITPEVATTLTTIMEGVVDRGTATLAKIPGYSIAGKTGTAAQLVNGRYSTSEYNASFVGFVPSRKPAFAIVVVIDSPHGRNGYYGGLVSAPVFKRIASAALRQYGIAPASGPDQPLLVVRREEAPEQTVSGPADPPAIVPVTGASGVGSVFPDLSGLSAREALNTLTKLGLTARLHGAGVVIAQQPEAGTALNLDRSAAVWLGRPPAASAPESRVRP
jgi:cell division protein FtsI (penicillin-binding protein 3)